MEKPSVKLKGNLIYCLITWLFLLVAGCSRIIIFGGRPPELIDKADQDLYQAKIAADRQRSALPEAIIAEEQLKKAKELQSLRTEVVARDIATTAAKKTSANDVSLPAVVSSLNSQIAITKAKEADLIEQNNRLELDLAKLQAEATRQWSEINRAQSELGVSSRAELEKKLEEERQARIKITERLDANQKAREEAALKSEARKQTEMEELKSSAMLEDYRKQQAELVQKLGSLNQEFMRIREEQRGIIVSLSNASFGTDTAALQAASAEKLDSFSQLLKDYPDRKILVEGHTDNTGSPDHNQMLSEKRADAVKSYLVSKGVSPERIEAKGYGDKSPVAANDTTEGRQLNRRVDIIILNPPGLS